MSNIEVDCSLIKKEGAVIGISLIAQPQTEAEFFCGSFPHALVKREGDIRLEDGKITFIDPKEGSVSFLIDNNDLEALRLLLTGERKIALYPDGFLTPGFKIILQGMEKDEDVSKIELKRIT